MRTRYFRKKDPAGIADIVEWVEMSGKEYYRFVTDPRNKNRYFHDMGDVVLECTEEEYKKYKAEDDHSSYILEQQSGWIIQSLEDAAREANVCREELVADITQDVETEAIRRIDVMALRAALAELDQGSYQLIHDLYSSTNRKTEREVAKAASVSQNAIHKQKKKVLETLKILVVKLQKSSQ